MSSSPERFAIGESARRKKPADNYNKKPADNYNSGESVAAATNRDL